MGFNRRKLEDQRAVRPQRRKRQGDARRMPMHEEWERSGAGVLKILAVEAPDKFAALASSLVPKQFDPEMPSVVKIITGVPRYGDDEPATVSVPQVPTPQIPVAPQGRSPCHAKTASLE